MLNVGYIIAFLHIICTLIQPLAVT